VAHRGATVEPKHERNILKEEPRRRVLGPPYEPEHFLNEARLFARDPSGSSSLAQILARKAGGDQVHPGQLAEGTYIWGDRDARKPGFENTNR